MRASGDALAATLADRQANDALTALLREALDLLGARFDKFPERCRPHYTPVQRFRILRLKHLAQLTHEEAARLFRVSPGTIARWEVEANPESQTVGSTITPTPPVRRYSDTVHHLVQTLAVLRFGRPRALAQHLALAGWRIAKTTVRRYLKQPRVPGPELPSPQTSKRAVKARFPHHVWHLDLTQIQGFLRSTTFSLATLLDSHSRMPLSWRVFEQPATAQDMCALVDEACAVHGKPRHLVVDKGGEFTAHVFKERISAWRANLRFCSADNHRANSRLERFWLGLKTVLRLRPPSAHWPLSRADLERDVERAMTYYARFRPH